MRQRGFGTLMLYGAIAAGVIILGLSIALKVQSSRLESEQAEHASTRQAYKAFKDDTKRIGEQAEAKAKAEKVRQDQVNKERAGSYEKRLSAINDAYKRLRDDRSGSGSRDVPSIPDASIRASDPASDNRLLEALRAADEQTLRLQELQAWVKQQGGQ